MNKEEMMQKLTEIAIEMDAEFPAVSGVIWILLGAIAIGQEKSFCLGCAEMGIALREELQAKMTAKVN